jgi:hypothetical protein
MEQRREQQNEHEREPDAPVETSEANPPTESEPDPGAGRHGPDSPDDTEEQINEAFQ